MTPLVTESGADLSRAHLIGAGGAGMSAIATILLDRGAAVSGSDAKASHALTGITARGARTAIGQRAENLDLLPEGPSAVIISTAIRADNPELVEAEARGIPVVRRAEALAALMSGHRSVCVAGTHGKTSTTSMLTVALQHAHIDPSFAIGGELNESGTGAHAGSGAVFVAEADESDGSFLVYRPHGAIITTIEADHLDHHGTPEAYAAVFDDFVERITPGGFLVAGVDDPGVVALIGRMRGRGPRVIGYGGSPTAQVRIGTISAWGHQQRAVVRLSDGSEVQLSLQLPGAHMFSNAVAALAAGVELGLPAHVMAEGLAEFTGVRRRFEFRGRVGGVRVYDDYAHHPTEVAATIAAARPVADGGRVVVVFQPHLYSRTATFASEFGRVLAAADVVVILDVYGAREEPVPGVTGQMIVDAVDAARAEVHYISALSRVPAVVADLVRDGDIVLTMGAGDVTMTGPEILRELAERTADAGDEPGA